MKPIKPTKWQTVVLQAPEEIDLGLFGGRGRGATTAALLLIIRACDKYPGSVHLMTRTHLRSLGEVEDTLQGLLVGVYGSKGLRINRQEHHFSLPNGSAIHMSPLADPMDLVKLQGVSYDTITADEYGSYSAKQMQMLDALRANLRGTTNCPKRLVYLANPAGRGHGAIVKRFINKCAPYVPTPLEDGTTFMYLPATARDNSNLPDNYQRDLWAAASRDSALYRAWADGNWKVARGACLADVIDESKQLFDWRKHGLPFDQFDCYKFLACDWGTASPSVCYLAVKTLAPLGKYPRGSLLLLDEVHSADHADLSVGLNWSPGRLADEITAMCDRWNIRNRSGVLDDARGLNPDETVIKVMREYRLFFLKPVKGRAAGLAKMRELLFNSKESNQRPGMWVSNLCEGWWETVPVLPSDPHRPDIPDTSANDHFYDASAYAATHEPLVMRVRPAIGTN